MLQFKLKNRDQSSILTRSMQQHINANFENLTLGNLNSKLKTMRDKLRNDVTNNLDYMHLKLSDQPSNGSNNPSQNHSEANFSNKNADAVESNQQNSNKQINTKGSGLQHQSSESYLYAELAQRPVDLQQVKHLVFKKISESHWDQYIKCTVGQEIVDRIKQIFQEIQDANEKVQTKELINKINRLSIKFSQSTAVEIPILRRKLTLKKILFQLYYKSKKMPQMVTWLKFKEALQDYRFPVQPTIDEYMIAQASNGQKAKNYFNLPREIVQQLKSVYQRSSKHSFLSYCPLNMLLHKLQQSKVIQSHLYLPVRPKSNYEVEVTLKDTINYISNHSPEFVDLDQFLLFFSVKGFTYYPIQQRFQPSKNQPIKKVKSQKHIQPKPKKHHYFDQYDLSAPNPNSIRNNKLQIMIQEEKNKKQAQLKKTFKAKPMPKSISKQKYQQFLHKFNHKIQQGRKALDTLRNQSQQQIQRLKSETKLFISPKKPQIQSKTYQITSRPPPSFIKQAKLDEIEVQKEMRRHKILSETQLKYQRSWKELPLVAVDHSPKCKQHQIKQNYQLQIRDIPNYRLQQQRVQEQLRQRKLQFHPTRPQPFHFHTQERHPKHQYQYTSHSPQPLEHYDYKEIIYSPEPQIYYTQKYADMVSANKKRVEQKQKEINQKIQQDAERQKRHENFAKFMKASLRKLPNTAKICENQAKMKIERHKKYWKNLDRQHENRLNEVYGKILQRPFLYQMQSLKAVNHNQQRENQPKITSPRNPGQPNKKKAKKNNEKRERKLSH